MQSSSSSSPSSVRGMTGGDTGLNQLGGGNARLLYVLSPTGADHDATRRLLSSTSLKSFSARRLPDAVVVRTGAVV